jgi:predicted nucleic acid-binding Zn ribbon protein
MLIKCPECGHEVSDKAPVCPNCGYKLNNKEKKNRTALFIIILLSALVIFGVINYFSTSAQNNKELAAYETALASNDTAVMQEFLDNYNDAPREHRDSIQAHISMLNAANREWTDAVISNSRAALQRYIDEHPTSLHAKEAMRMIDSIDWESAVSASTPEALKSYIEGHPNGNYVDEANDMIRNINATVVLPEEKLIISSLFRNFFQGVNAKDENRLTSTVNSLLTTFLGKQDATKSDVITFMKKLWKDDVLNLNWHIIDNYQIEKKEVGNEEYEFAVTFSATELVEKEAGNTENKYRIKARVNPDGKICEFNMSKVIE